MFEFLDTKLITATVLLLFAYGLLDMALSKEKDSRGRPRKKSSKWLYLAIMSIPIFVSYFSMQDAQESIAKFKNNSTLRCSIDKLEYIVSKKEQWHLKEYYFTKDSLLIRADMCEEFE